MDIATVDHLLTTTRSVRKRLDLERPVEPEVIQQCLEIAIQAPTGSNAQGWHFMVVANPEKRAAIGQLYKESFRLYADSRKQKPPDYAKGDPRADQVMRVYKSSSYLARHMSEVPVQIIPCLEGRVQPTAGNLTMASFYGSILPAAWSLMLALRSRGLGAAWTTLHLRYEQTVAEILGIPDTVTQAGLLAVAYYTGADFKPAKRIPAKERTYWNSWGKRANG